MSDINLTASMRTNLLSLQSTQSDMDTVSERLATGLKINSAIDNPSSYYTACALDSRVSDLSALMDAMGQSISTISAALEGIDSGTNFLEQASAVAVQATAVSKDFSDYTQVSTLEELQTALEDETISKIVLTESIYLTDYDTLTIGEGVTLSGYDEDVSINISITEELYAYNVSASTATGSIIMSDGSCLENISVNLDKTTSMSYRATVIYASAADFTLNNVDINASGDRVYGVSLYSGSTLNGDDINVSAVGGCTYSVYAYNSEINANMNLTIDGGASAGIYLYISSITSDSNINISNESSISGTYAINTLRGTVDGNINITCSEGSTGIHLYYRSSIASSANISISTESGTAIHASNQENTIEAGASLTLSSDDGKMLQYIVSEQIDSYGSYTPDFADEEVVSEGSQSEYVETLNKVIADAFEDKTIDLTEELSSYSTQYISILEQYDSLISDSSYNGLNLLAKDYLTTYFNEDGSSYLEIEGVDASSNAIGLAEAKWSTLSDVLTSINELTDAINTLRSYSIDFGTQYSILENREDFTEALINVLQTGSDKLTLADMNEESANMLALQTRQQLATNSLSLSSQSAQQVLSMFA